MVWPLASPRADDPRARAREKHSLSWASLTSPTAHHPGPEGMWGDFLEGGLAGAPLGAGHSGFFIVSLMKKQAPGRPGVSPGCHSLV